jgi:hypothetical protein
MTNGEPSVDAPVTADRQPAEPLREAELDDEAFVFSGQITSGQESYRPAGAVIALISFLVGFGVCLHLGAVFRRMWNDWRAERR